MGRLGPVKIRYGSGFLNKEEEEVKPINISPRVELDRNIAKTLKEKSTKIDQHPKEIKVEYKLPEHIQINEDYLNKQLELLDD